MNDSSMADKINALGNLRLNNDGARENGRPPAAGSSSSSSLTAAAPPFFPSARLTATAGPSSSLTTAAPPFLPSASLLLRVPEAFSTTHPPPGFPPIPTAVVTGQYRLAIGRDQDSETARCLLVRMMTCSEGYTEFKAMVERCDQTRLRLLASFLTSDKILFFELAQNQHGSTCLRKLLGRCSDVDDMFFTAVVDLFVPIMTDKFGHYVAMQTLDAVERPKKTVLYQLTETHALELARDETGCVALNDVITVVRGLYRERILNLVANNALWLSQDPSGNFVVQHVLELGNPFCTQKIASALYGHYVCLSSQRLGSYVVEKVLESRFMTLVVDELLKSGDQLLRLARNEFGNYVLQTALKVTSKRQLELYERLVLNLKPFFEILRGGYGRNIVALIGRLTMGRYENDQTR